MRRILRRPFAPLLLLTAIIFVQELRPNAQPQSKPNILVIMGDDIGWYNTSIYNRGDMGIGRLILTASATRARCS